ncbi:MAG: hypothetical protein ED557_02475 [Balneola sp.]|nr:MAG: hypothetical protein ED557_02475 [Balneola sp.]
MQNKTILITGCQRSGTTLLNLILDSHPEIHGIDEADFKLELLQSYLNDSKFHPYVSFKLPNFSAAVRTFEVLPNLKVFWSIRDYRDVISSMINLTLKVSMDSSKTLSWVVHPNGAPKEIKNCITSLQHNLDDDLMHLIEKYKIIINNRSVLENDREQQVFIGALCWRLKQELLSLYDSNKVDYSIIYYENLIRKPKEELSNLLNRLNLKWHSDMLNHHKLHTGISIGKTDNTKPIDSSNAGKWKAFLTPNEITIAEKICATIAYSFGYQ